MPSIRLTADNVAACISDWAATADSRSNSLVFRGSEISQDAIRSLAWDAGLVVSIDPVSGDLWRVVFCETLIERQP